MMQAAHFEAEADFAGDARDSVVGGIGSESTDGNHQIAFGRDECSPQLVDSSNELTHGKHGVVAVFASDST
ncbi:hypothetical protein D3C80_1986620 [compost metagenome]